jgi:hypothetical protein
MTVADPVNFHAVGIDSIKCISPAGKRLIPELDFSEKGFHGQKNFYI